DFSASEPDVSYECNLDGAGFMPCADPVTFVNLADGPHGLEVRARDAAGNVDASPATSIWMVDLAAVDTFIDLRPVGVVADAFAAFAFSANKKGATFECSLDGVGFAPCPTPVTFSKLADGKHTLAVRAVDVLGGGAVDATPASRTWTIDTGAGDKDG